MTALVEPSARRAESAVSPELALVDPALGESERAQLVLPSPLPRPGPELTWRRDERDRPAVAVHLQLGRFRDLGDTALELVRRRPRAVAGGAIVLVAAAALAWNMGLHPGDSRSAGEGTPPGTVAPSPTTVREPAAAPNAAPRRFAWAPVENADGYHVELFLGSDRVFSANSKQPSLTVPAHWTFRGERRSLAPGDYQWYVWPVVSGTRAPNAVVRAKLVVPTT